MLEWYSKTYKEEGNTSPNITLSFSELYNTVFMRVIYRHDRQHSVCYPLQLSRTAQQSHPVYRPTTLILVE